MLNTQLNQSENSNAVVAIWGNTEEVMRMIGFKRTKLGKLMRSDTTFPKPIRLSQNHIRWNLSEVRQWIAAKEAARGE